MVVLSSTGCRRQDSNLHTPDYKSGPQPFWSHRQILNRTNECFNGFYLNRITLQLRLYCTDGGNRTPAWQDVNLLPQTAWRHLYCGLLYCARRETRTRTIVPITSSLGQRVCLFRQAGMFAARVGFEPTRILINSQVIYLIIFLAILCGLYG